MSLHGSVPVKSARQQLVTYPLALAYGWKPPAHDLGPLYMYPPIKACRGYRQLYRDRLEAIDPRRLHPSAAEYAEDRYLVEHRAGRFRS